jgi:very-short-patch-repair endonuclease
VRSARKLRNNQTEGEKKLWTELRNWKKEFGLHVRRQVPIGDYVADFAIHSARLVIEVDGQFHFTAEGRERDMKREEFLAKAGYSIVRINTGELDEAFEGSVEKIMHAAGLMR